MTVQEKVFHVLTEFRFDVQGAIANSEALQGAVGKISGAADTALFSLSKLKMFATSALGVNMSAFGLIGAAISANEKYQQSVLSFANIIGSNLDVLSGDVTTFNDRLAVSDKILKNIAKTARDFSLDEQAMINTTKALAPVLVQEGMAGKNMGNAIDMARMFEKSAPVLGVDTGLAQGQLINAVLGNSSMNDTLFRRLATETTAFKQQFRGAGVPGQGGAQPIGKGAVSMAQQFNRLAPEKRFKLLTDALKQFSSDADVMAASAGTLTQRLVAVKNQIIGIDGVLRPLGAVISKPLQEALGKVSVFLNSKGRVIGEDLSKLVASMIGNPEKLYATVLQIQQLRSDLTKAGAAAHAIGLVGIISMLGGFALRIGVVRSALLTVGKTLMRWTGVAAFAAAGFGLKNFAVIAMFSFKLLKFAFMSLVLPLMAMTALFQVLSRAKAYGQIQDLKTFAQVSDRIIPTLARLKESFGRFVAPFEMVFDKIARFISPLFAISTYAGPAITGMEMLASILDTGADIVLGTIAVLHASFTVIAQVFLDMATSIKVTLINIKEIIVGTFSGVADKLVTVFSALKNFEFGKANAAMAQPINMDFMSNLTKAPIKSPGELAVMFNSAFDEIMAANLQTLNNPQAKDKNVVNHSTHIGSVNIRQDFKENQEPDRIAHSLVKTIKDISINPTQATGRGFAAPLAR